jgi:HSP20 family molecular chaperone IbpA
MSAKWRPTNKNRKWLKLSDNSAKPKNPRPAQKSHVKSIPAHQNFRPSKSYAKRKFEEPQPLIDIFQDPYNIIIIAEIAGFNRETLKISVKDQKLTLSAKTKDRRYYKSLNLPKVVIPNAMHTEYKNGVLEIKLKKAEIIDKEAKTKCHID